MFVLLLLVLILLIVLLMRRRRSNVSYVPSASPTMIVSTPPIMEQSPPTSMLNDAGMDMGNAQPVAARGGETIALRQPLAVLEFSSGELAGKRFPIGATETQVLTIGREPDPGPNSVRINSKFVSRKHATIAIENGAIYLTDLNSSSGTKVNGERLAAAQRRDIKIGDKIEFADTSAEIKQA